MRGEPLVGVTSFVVVVAAEIVRRPGQGYGTGDHLAGIVGYFVGTPGPRRTDPIQLTYVLLVWLAGWPVGYATARQRIHGYRSTAKDRQSSLR
jgi:hypothetical protein